jgi:hypothetical protein
MRDSSRRILALVILLTMTAALAGRVPAQDTNYWTQQYGTQGELLLGTVVGSIIDLSAVYYNPGALALQKNPSLILGTKAFEYESIKFRDDEGNASPIESQRFGPAPTLFAGTLPMRWLKGQIGYSVLTRNDFDFRIQEVGSEFLYANPPDSLGVLGGEVYLDQDFTGVWGGPTWARSWGRMGLGVTGFFAYQGQRTRSQVLFQGLETPDRGASATYIDGVDYWHVRLVFKLGVIWDYSPFTFGFAVTAPGIGLFGQGSSLANVFINGIDLDGDGVPDTELIANNVKDAPAEYRSPASFAGGLSYRFKNTTLHFTSEYFGKVEEYEVMQTVLFESPTTGKTYAHKMPLALDDVLNWGVGVERHIRPWLKAYGSFITDGSAAGGNLPTSVAVSNWDLYHVMAGTAFRFIGSDITLGAGYTWGSGHVPRHRNIVTPTGPADIPFASPETTVEYRRWKLIFGFAFGAGEKQSNS